VPELYISLELLAYISFSNKVGGGALESKKLRTTDLNHFTLGFIVHLFCLQTGEIMSIPESHTVIQVPVDDFVTMINNYCKVRTLYSAEQ